MIYRFELPFPTPSQNRYDRMGRWARNDLVTSYTNLIALKLLNDGRGVPRWAQKRIGGARGFKTCSRVTCRAPVALADERGNHWCGDHHDPLEPAKREVYITRYSPGTLDEGNLVGGCKALLDAIVRQGLVYDDKPKWCVVDYEQRKVPRSQAATAVEVHPA